MRNKGGIRKYPAASVQPAPVRKRKVRCLWLCSLNFLGLWVLVVGGAQTGRSQTTVQQGGDFSQNPQAKKLPTGVLLVKGAWSSASDSVTPLPEVGDVAAGFYANKYFRLRYPLSEGWTQKYYGPPPSDGGFYVLAQIGPGEVYKGASRVHVLLSAQDLFFTLSPATNAFELVNLTTGKLQPDYKVEHALAPVNIAGHLFLRFDYFSPVAELHWYVLATQIRCHMVQFVFTGRDTKLMESLVQGMSQMKLPAEASPILGDGGDDVPVCIKDYAHAENVIERVEPVFAERRFNPIPVRIIIDKEGKVKHIHFLSAFPDQAKVITAALWQWRFKPYLRDGQAREVETGIMFGRVPRLAAPPATQRPSE